MRSPAVSYLWWLIPGGSVVAGFWGCGGADALGVGGGGTSGAVASASGSSGGGGLSIAGAGGASGLGLASACSSDAACGGALFCLLPTMSNDAVFGGGAPGGFCTRACTQDLDCGPGAVCYANEQGQTGHCTLACTIGPPIAGVDGLFTPLLAGKCRQRDDVRCSATTGDAGACLPTCSSDDQCDGVPCDPAMAVCVTSPSTGLPTGVACDASAPEPGCAGSCVSFTSGVRYSMCSRPCVLGGAGDTSPECGGPKLGLCAFHQDAFGAGDLGYCTLACSAHADCQNPNYGCFTVPLLTPSSGKGYCFGATPCPDGQADCASGDVCTPTAAGPVCLEATFSPDAGTVEDAGPGDAGVQDAGDAGPVDAGLEDAGPEDAGPVDAGPEDAGATDAGPGDAGLGDAGDAGGYDAGPGDAGGDGG